MSSPTTAEHPYSDQELLQTLEEEVRAEKKRQDLLDKLRVVGFYATAALAVVGVGGCLFSKVKNR